MQSRTNHKGPFQRETTAKGYILVEAEGRMKLFEGGGRDTGQQMWVPSRSWKRHGLDSSPAILQSAWPCRHRACKLGNPISESGPPETSGNTFLFSVGYCYSSNRKASPSLPPLTCLHLPTVCQGSLHFRGCLSRTHERCAYRLLASLIMKQDSSGPCH